MRTFILSLISILLLISSTSCMKSAWDLIYPSRWHELCDILPYKFGDSLSVGSLFKHDMIAVRKENQLNDFIFFSTGDYISIRKNGKIDGYGIYCIKDSVIDAYKFNHWSRFKCWDFMLDKYQILSQFPCSIMLIESVKWGNYGEYAKNPMRNYGKSYYKKVNAVVLKENVTSLYSIDSSYIRQQKWMWRDKKEWEKWMESHSVKIAIPDD